jgi:hypothetical protein
MAMEMAVESMEMAPGAIPSPGRVSEQRLLSPEIGLRWRQHCRTFRRWRLIDLGFSRRRLFISGGAMSEGTRGAHTRWWRGQGCTRATRWCGHLLALLRLWFGLHQVSGKIGTLGFVLFNSENISYVTFLKHKNSRKQELAVWHLVNRLVPENAYKCHEV